MIPERQGAGLGAATGQAVASCSANIMASWDIHHARKSLSNWFNSAEGVRVSSRRSRFFGPPDISTGHFFSESDHIST